tara:strand:- start:4218 stop:5426 length:1209 start_codon:yes stop_codon:yes gene_type:complete
MKLNIPQLKISRGFNSNVWDSRQNKFIDFSMSNGALLLGHSNKILKKSVIKSIKLGSNFSNENIYKEKYKKLILDNFKEFYDLEFSNSGSEANLRALRICKSITKKNKFAMISGSWHGSVDTFMYDLDSKKNNNNKISLSAGNSNYSKDVYVLPHNNLKKSIEILKKVKKEISMIIIETVQASFPDKKNIDYLVGIYNFAKKNKIYIVFDEVITGMRVDKLSIFKKYNLSPDIVTLGKCFGGGLPIGITCMSSLIYKKLTKLKKKVFFGGTFSGNSLVMNAGFDTLTFLLKNKKLINEYINTQSSKIENEINNFAKDNGIQFKLLRYESILRPIFTSREIFSKIERAKFDKDNFESNRLRFYLQKNHILLPRNGCIFISYSHTKQQINQLIILIKKYILKHY